MKHQKTLLWGASLSMLATALLPAEATAQTPPPAADQTGLEEIVVTAQRRAENQQSVPIAVTTITAAAAERIGIKDPEAVAQAVPGLTLNRSAASAVPFLRGVGTPSSTIGNEPSIATFIDDVYISNGAAAFFEFNNIAQIEVLKGPQGTLFGRNATGGVLQIRTKNPTQDLTADVNATYGNYKTYGGQAYVSGGLTETLSANIAAYYKKQADGWGTNLPTGRDIYDSLGYGVRAKLLFDNGAGTTVLLNGDYEHRRGSEGLGGRVVPGTFGRGGYSPEAAGAGFYDTTSTTDNHYINTIKQISGKVTHDLGNVLLTSITSFTKLESIGTYDIDVAPTPFFAAQIDQQGKTFTQEIQLASAPGSAVNWLIGGFYLNDKAQFPALYVGTAFGTGGGVGTGTVDTRQNTNSLSGFGQASAEILPKTTMTIGVRYTSDKRDFTGQTGIRGTLLTPFAAAKRFSNVTGRFSLDYKFTPDILGYVAYNRGFKSGIYNLGAPGPGTTVAPDPANPENLNAYSAGFKTEWFNRKLRVNVEGYYYDYRDIQVATLLTVGQVITNAGAAHMKGVDIDITAAPVKGLTLSAQVGYEDGKYTKFPNGPKNLPLPPNAPVSIPANGACTTTAGAPIPPYPTGTAPLAVAQCNLAGVDTVNTPKLSTVFSATWRVIDGAVPIDLAGSWSRKSHYFFEADNNPSVRQPTNNIVNASITAHFADEKFDIRLWANNIGNRKYYSYITQSATSGTKYSPAPPRTYGVTVGAHY